MSIPESQLQTWSNQGAIVSAQNTHTSIRNAINVYQKWPTEITYNAYLQGSYINATNIYSNSDVDLIVEMTFSFYSNLTHEEKVSLKLVPATCEWKEFRSHVIAALIEYYGSNLIDTSGSKSVKVIPDSGRLKADVVIAATYRHYENLSVRSEGITLWKLPNMSDQIINYPKLHINNGANKNSDRRTAGRYKPTIRIFKNAREKIYLNKPQLKNKFPSYFIEGLLYNVPDEKYNSGSIQEQFVDILNWLHCEIYSERVNNLICQNEMHYLFGNSTVNWNILDAREYIAELIELWNNW